MPDRMSVKEFRERGFLQELNRLFLHPLGLALEVIIDNKTDAVAFGGIWQTDDPEGIVFEDIDIDKIERVREWSEAMVAPRLQALGYIVQPPKTAT